MIHAVITTGALVVNLPLRYPTLWRAGADELV